MNIEKFYYDEQTEMYELMKKEQDEHEQSLSVEEREKEHQKLFQEARTIMKKAERERKVSAHQFCKVSEICISVRTGNTVFKNLRM